MVANGSYAWYLGTFNGTYPHYRNKDHLVVYRHFHPSFLPDDDEFCRENVVDFKLASLPDSLEDLASVDTDPDIQQITAVCFQDLLLRAQSNVARHKQDNPTQYPQPRGPVPVDAIHIASPSNSVRYPTNDNASVHSGQLTRD